MTLIEIAGGVKYETEFMQFIRLKPNPKTHRFLVIARQGEKPLGIVKWYAPWRRYCTFLNADTNIDAKCHRELAEFLEMLMDQRRRQQ